MYLPFGKSCKKLLDVKCITLNSSLISRLSLAQQINTYLIIIKTIQISTLLTKTNSTNTKGSSLPFENLIKTNTQVSLLHNINFPTHIMKLQIPYWIANLKKNKNI